MPYRLIWLADVLRREGLKVAEVAGWQTRGLGDVGNTLGVICHHTVGPRRGNMPSLDVLVKGRAGNPARNVKPLRGPLAQLGLGRDGTFYVVAAGLCNHAGTGSWQRQENGNTHFIGIEAENAGTDDDPFPAVQMDAWVRGVAAILRRVGAPAAMCCGHKEWAPSRKPLCPHIDMAQFRRRVQAVLDGTAIVRPIIPASTRLPDDTVLPTLRRGQASSHVRMLKQHLGLDAASDLFDGPTEAAVRAFQRLNEDAEGIPLVPDGIVGPKTWAALRRAPAPVPGGG